MQNVLLDTNALVFYASGANRFGKKSLRILDKSNLFYSPLSLIELKIKAQRGKFRGSLRSEDLAVLGINEILLDSAVADHLPNLETADPFDAMLVAQAKAKELSFMTSDIRILESRLDFVLDLSD
jgi:PIN domain nuclease of toxin-antitoxin system